MRRAVQCLGTFLLLCINSWGVYDFQLIDATLWFLSLMWLTVMSLYFLLTCYMKHNNEAYWINRNRKNSVEGTRSMFSQLGKKTHDNLKSLQAIYLSMIYLLSLFLLLKYGIYGLLDFNLLCYMCVSCLHVIHFIHD